MSVLILCPNPACGELLDVPDDAVGTEVRCPACGTSVKVPGQPVAERAPGTQPAPAPSPKTSAAAAPRQPAPAEAAEAPPAVQTARRAVVEPAPAPADMQDEVDLTPMESFEHPREQPARAPGAPPAPARPGPQKKRPEPGRPAPPAEARPPGSAAAERDYEEIFKHAMVEALNEELTAAPAEETGVLAPRLAPLAVLLVALAGMGCGILVGVLSLPQYAVPAAYVGAGVGWVAGFIVGLILVMSVGSARCPVCRQPVPDGADLCQNCGAPIPNATPLAGECLSAGGWAARNAKSLAGPVSLLVVADLTLGGMVYLRQHYPADYTVWQPALLTAAGLLGFGIFAWWLHLLLSASDHAAYAEAETFHPPRLLEPVNVLIGVKGLVALAAYVVPVYTLPLLPLLPLRLLSLRRQSKSGLLDLAGTLRTAWGQPQNFVVLWLMVLLWSSATVLAVAVIAIAFPSPNLVRMIWNLPGSGVLAAFSAAETAVLGLVGGVFALAVFRCIGLYGCHGRSDFHLPPGEPEQADVPPETQAG